MRVFRFGPKRFAPDLEGLGAEKFGGRWNHVGTACIYASATKSLAMLEYSAHLSLVNFKPELVFTTYEIPDHTLLRHDLKNLPIDWNSVPALKLTMDIGTNHFKSNPNSLGIIVPSIIIPDEFNYIINPLSTKFKSVRVLSVEDHTYDLRIKL